MIIFDEAAFMPDIIFDVVLPSIIGSTNHKIILNKVLKQTFQD